MNRKIFNDNRIDSIKNKIRETIGYDLDVGIILGSGWGAVCDCLENKTIIPYSSLDGMPQCSVKGHSGNFVFGSIGDKKVVIAQGRFHLYEGKSFDDVLLPLKIMYSLGINYLFLTNAAGGLNDNFKRGDLMVLSDHINFTFKNPLISVEATEEYPIFCDMTHVYDNNIQNIISEESKKLNVKSHSGVYMQLLGPSYETPAEIKAFKNLGADAVGMSTVVEAIYAKYLKLKIAGISIITNMGAGIEKTNLDHHDVLAQAKKNETMYSKILFNSIKRIF